MAAPICLVCPLVHSVCKGLGADALLWRRVESLQPSTGPLSALVTELSLTLGSVHLFWSFYIPYKVILFPDILEDRSRRRK